jgi:hypothetical protein
MSRVVREKPANWKNSWGVHWISSRQGSLHFMMDVHVHIYVTCLKAGARSESKGLQPGGSSWELAVGSSELAARSRHAKNTPHFVRMMKDNPCIILRTAVSRAHTSLSSSGSPPPWPFLFKLAGCLPRAWFEYGDRSVVLGRAGATRSRCCRSVCLLDVHAPPFGRNSGRARRHLSK